MALTPLDIRNKEFRKTFRGYDEEEVDDFLDMVVNEYEKIYKENAELKEAIAAKDSNIGQYKDLEDTLQKTLVIAQQTSDDIKQAAVREADVIIKEARLKAEQIVAGADEKSRSVLKDYEDLQKQANILRVKLRSFLLSQLELIGSDESLELPAGRRADNAIASKDNVDDETKVNVGQSA